MPEFQAPTGTFDVLPPASRRYERLIELYVRRAERAGCPWNDDRPAGPRTDGAVLVGGRYSARIA